MMKSVHAGNMMCMWSCRMCMAFRALFSDLFPTAAAASCAA